MLLSVVNEKLSRLQFCALQPQHRRQRASAPYRLHFRRESIDAAAHMIDRVEEKRTCKEQRRVSQCAVLG